MSSRSILRILIAVLAALSLLTGCKSSHRGVKGSSGSVYNPARDKVTLEECLDDVRDPMARALILEAEGWLGTRYVYGGASKQGTDCSGLVMSLFKDVCELKIPRTTRDQVRYCTRVARNKMRPGDLVFFAHDGTEDKVSHVGLYIGQGRMIHASSSRGVMVSGFDSGYWGERYFTGARIDNAPKAFAAANKGKRWKEPSMPAPDVPAPSLPVKGVPEVQLSIPLEQLLLASSAPQPAETTAPESADNQSAAVMETASVSVPQASQTPQASTGGTMSIDLLDLIINQKVDSIFTSGFAD